MLAKPYVSTSKEEHENIRKQYNVILFPKK